MTTGGGPATPAERFRDLVEGSAAAIDLVEACGLVAEHHGHPMSTAALMGAFDDLAGSTATAIDDAGRSATLDAIADHLLVGLGFHGDRQRYHDVRNSLLPEVLGRRIGIPITLAVVVIGVADRLGVRASGVGMPGHFLVGDGAAPHRWLDAFDGSWLDETGAEERFRSVHGPGATFDRAFLAPTPTPQIVARVLNNLAHLHRSTGDPTLLLRSVELLALIPSVGRAPRVQAELAAALAAVGRISDAVAVLEAVRERVEPARQASVGAHVEQLRASLN